MANLDRHRVLEELYAGRARAGHGRARRIDLPIAPKPSAVRAVAILVPRMARPSKEPPTSSPLVPAIVRYAAARGLDVEALAWRFGLPAQVAALDEATAAADMPEELFRTVASAASAPQIALDVAAELTSRRLKLAELAVRASDEVRSALQRLARWAPLLHEGLEAALEETPAGAAEKEGPVRWVLRTPRRPRGLGRYVHEVALGWALRHVRAGSGGLSPVQVWFAHPRPPDLAPLHAFFDVSDLAFGREDSGFAIARAELDRPMLLADRHAVDTLAPLVEAELAAHPPGASLAARVAAFVAGSLPGGTDVGEVARAMHMSARTLQRRLEQEQTSFGDVLDQARLTTAGRLLANPEVTLADVAFRVGFADVATFSRAFKRWTGLPPGQWRRS
jgi:AraC-like DNA-binding protein